MEEEIISRQIQGIAQEILSDYGTTRRIDRMDIFQQPDKQIVIGLADKLLRIVFPGFFKEKTYRVYSTKTNLSMLLEDIAFLLNRQIAVVLSNASRQTGEGRDLDSQEITLEFLRGIPKIRACIETDVQATFEGDPAAYDENEIIFSYPGIYAITIHRLAHALHLLKVPIIPRIMSEHAHSRTGIDIHPGASIGEYFFMDHGTGIVIGETTVIGNHVKIYQGVTLGALSTQGGRSLQQKKRHPTIEDYVTIYSGASILGGNTVIGKHSIIGGNVFITRSVAPGTQISVKNQELHYDKSGKSVERTDFEENEAWFYVI